MGRPYILLTLSVSNQLMFNAENKAVYVHHIELEAVLHSAQFDDPNKFNQIKKLMWENLCKENGLAVSGLSNCVLDYKHRLIPKGSRPITYKI